MTRPKYEESRATSHSHWGLFPYEPKTLVWPKGLKVSVGVEEFRGLIKEMGFQRVVIDKSDIT